MWNRCLVAKDFEGSSTGLLGALLRNLPGEAEKNHENPRPVKPMFL
jgi:hypothetical protein